LFAVTLAILIPITVVEVAAGQVYTTTFDVPIDPVILFLNVFAILFLFLS
jgi:hypothetical protein